MKKISKEKLLKGGGSFVDGEHKYEIIEVDGGYIYHSHVFNTSTYVPFKPEPAPPPVIPDATLLALDAIASTWDLEALDADVMFTQINQLIGAQKTG